MKPKEPFAQVVHATQVLVEAPFQRPLQPVASPEHPTREGHLSWMLLHAVHLLERGNQEQAYLWLGFVQGVLAMRGMPLYELDLANRDEQCLGGYASGAAGKSRVTMLKLLAGMGLATDLDVADRRWALVWLGGLATGTPDPQSLELLDLVLDQRISFNEARERDQAREP